MTVRKPLLKSCKKLLLDFVDEQNQKMVEFIRTEYELPDFNPDVTVCFRERRVNSFGGIYGDGTPFCILNANLVMWMIPQGPNCEKWFVEYPFLSFDPEIGDVRGSWKTYMGALLSHELAHAVVYYSEEIEKKENNHEVWSRFDQTVLRDRRPHGKLWQSVYRKLRTVFVNGVKFNMRYTVNAETEKTTRPYKRQFETLAFEKDGGRYVTYKVNGEEVGRLFSKFKKPIQVWNNETNSYVDTAHTSLVAARDEILAPYGIKKAPKAKAPKAEPEQNTPE